MPIPNKTLPIANWLMQQLANKLQKEEQDIKTKGNKQYFKYKGNQIVRVVGENMPYFIPGSQAYMGLKAVDDFKNGNNTSGIINTAFAATPFISPTEKFLRFLGNPRLTAETAKTGYFFGPEKQLIKKLEQSGIELEQIPARSIQEALQKRLSVIKETAPDEYIQILSHPLFENSYQLIDLRKGEKFGNMFLNKFNSKYYGQPLLYIDAVEGKYPGSGTYERLLNGGIELSKIEKTKGVVSGESLKSAPKTYHINQKIKDREPYYLKGIHDNLRMVYDRLGYEPIPTPAKNMLELRRASDKEAKVLKDAPVWILKSPTYEIPIKSEIFDPSIIDTNGNMIIDWNNLNPYYKKGGKL